MKDIKSFLIGFLMCACMFLIMGQTKKEKTEERIKKAELEKKARIKGEWESPELEYLKVEETKVPTNSDEMDAELIRNMKPKVKESTPQTQQTSYTNHNRYQMSTDLVRDAHYVEGGLQYYCDMIFVTAIDTHTGKVVKREKSCIQKWAFTF